MPIGKSALVDFTVMADASLGSITLKWLSETEAGHA